MKTGAEMDHVFVDVARFISRWSGDLAGNPVDDESIRTIDLNELKRIVALCKRPLPPGQEGHHEFDMLRQHAESCQHWMLEHIDTVVELASLPAWTMEAQIMKRLAQHWIATVGSRIFRDWKCAIEQECFMRGAEAECRDEDAPVTNTRATPPHRWFAKTTSWNE